MKFKLRIKKSRTKGHFKKSNKRILKNKCETVRGEKVINKCVETRSPEPCDSPPLFLPIRLGNLYPNEWGCPNKVSHVSFHTSS